MWMQIFSSRGMVGAGVGGLCWTLDGGVVVVGMNCSKKRTICGGENAKTHPTHL